jgi:hypothetical protein
VVISAVIFLAMDFAPRHGPPDFRYTGSDPERIVWNIGWPCAWAIYDPQSGVQIGPWLIISLPPQVFFLAFLHGLTMMWPLIRGSRKA